MDFSGLSAMITGIAGLLIAISSMVAAALGVWNAVKGAATHKLINSRMDELLRLSKAASFAAGERAEKANPSPNTPHRLTHAAHKGH